VVVVEAGIDRDEPRAHARCNRCGERFVFPLPMRIQSFVEVSKGFVRAHRDCRAAAVTHG